MYIVDFSQMLGVCFGEFYLCFKVMTTTIPCVDALQNCDQYNYTLICDRDGIYATCAKQNCRAYCGYCTSKIILKSKFFLVKKIKCGICIHSYKIYEPNFHITSLFPTIYACKSTFYCQRGKEIPKLPISPQDIVLEGKWTRSNAGDNFLVADDGKDSRIVIFGTNSNINYLAASYRV